MTVHALGAPAGPDGEVALAATLRSRLAELRTELDAGRAEVARLDARRDELVSTMLRISGAVQVLEELLGDAPEADG